MRISLIAMLLLCSFGLQAQDMLTPEQLQEDFRQFRRQLFKHNKGVDLFISKKEYKAYLDEIESQLDKEMTNREFFQLIRKAVVPVKEGHLAVTNYGGKVEGEKSGRHFVFGENRRLFPLAVQYMNDSTAYVIKNIDEEVDSTIPFPSRLFSINGRSMKAIRDSIDQYIVVDTLPNEQQIKNYVISKSFQTEHYFHVDTSSTFIIEWEDPNMEKQTDTLKGFSQKLGMRVELKKNATSKVIDSLQIAYLNIDSFSVWNLKRKDIIIDIRKDISDFFETVKEKKYEHVIIDLRDNGGGEIDNAFYLLSYLQENSDKKAYDLNFKPFLFSIRRWGFFIKSPYRKNKEYRTWEKNDSSFDGNLYILTNEGTYSASVNATRLAKAYHTNTMIIGQPVAGRDSGSSAGSFKIVLLKNSGVLLKIPQMVLTYKHDVDITPDVLVSPRIEDFFNEESDAVLEKTLEIIKEKQNNEN